MDRILQKVAFITCLCSTSVSAEPNAERLSTAMSPARHAPPAAVFREARVARYAARGGEVDSLLLREQDAVGEQRLTGVTHLRDGTRLWEEARFDRAGKLLRAETMCTSANGASETVVFDADAGSVELRSTRGARRWTVPTDYPWVWAARGCGSELQGASVATPLAAIVATRASKDGKLRRLIDTHNFTSHSITTDQVLVPEDANSVWVVLGDDAVLVRDGQPERWHVNTLHVDVEQR